ncbi:MAG: D-glycerate dehydrogenase [Gemmatimonadaceae bacterium]
MTKNLGPHNVSAASYTGDASARPTVIVTRRLPPAVEERLSQRYTVTLNPSDRQYEAAELRAALCTADVLLCTLTDRLTRDVLLVPNRRTRLLANFGVGYDHIDLAAAREAGLIVTNTPGVLTEDTADLTLLLMLSVARRASEGEQELRAGAWTGWRPTHLLGRSVHGATLGIIGFGRIGQAVARRAALGFGMTVQYLARKQSPGDEIAAPVRDLGTLLSTSDFVSLHCPATPDTHHVIRDETLRQMKPTAYLINTARGPVVDSAALARALGDGTIAGAGLDVYEGEPRVHRDLLSAPHVTLLPHLGSATIAARTAMGMIAADNIDAFVGGRQPPHQLA